MLGDLIDGEGMEGGLGLYVDGLLLGHGGVRSGGRVVSESKIGGGIGCFRKVCGFLAEQGRMSKKLESVWIMVWYYMLFCWGWE